MTGSEPTKIERKTLIRAPRSRVWQALTTPQEFCQWFSCETKDSFEVGNRIELASTHPLSKGKGFYFIVERLEPEHTFAWRWHPGSAKPGEDGTTLVEFHLEEVPEGTMVTVVETGFDRISLARRAKAFTENGRGWDLQLEAFEKYAGSQAA
jgi:uncharacterized protein YndB with AHSA1/START domain